MCGLRDVLGVFGGFRPRVLGLGRSLRAGICNLRDVLDVFRRSIRVWIDNVVFARRFGGVRGIRAKVRMCRLRDVSEVFF